MPKKFVCMKIEVPYYLFTKKKSVYPHLSSFTSNSLFDIIKTNVQT